MRSGLFTHRLGGWIALWALAVAALAPAVSQFLRQDSGLTWLEVCTLTGARVVATDATANPARPTPDKSSVDQLFNHCPYCVLQHVAAAPPVSVPVLTLLPLSFGLPERFLSAPRTLFAWRAAQPRGPPLLD